MKARTGIALVVPLAMALLACSAAAAPTWQKVQTLEYVRGIPEPRVAIDGGGKAAVVYSQALDSFDDRAKVRIYTRPAGSGTSFFEPGLLPGESDPAVAVSPAGAMAIATVEEGRLHVVLYPVPGPKPRPPWDGPRPAEVVVEGGGAAVGEPQVTVDGAGTATVVWVSPPSGGGWPILAPPSRVHATTVSPGGVVGTVEQLGEPGSSCAPRVAAALRGDVVVLPNCAGAPDHVFVKPAGGSFGAGEAVPGFASGPTDVVVGGGGEVTAIEAGDRSQSPRQPYEYRAHYSTRPNGGVFGPSRPLPLDPSSAGGLQVESQEDGRTVAAWHAGTDVHYAVRPAGGDFGQARLLARAVGRPGLLGLVAAPRGPMLLWWQGVGPGQFTTSVLSPDGRAELPTPVGVRGGFTSVFAPSFAIDERGRAIGAWEQRCDGGGFAVMTVVRDEAGGEPLDPPCQDMRAPKVIAVRRKASLTRRVLRVRVACDERCRITAKARVLRAGRRKPIALSKTRGELSLGARRGAWVRLRLSRLELRRVRGARRAGRKVTVRLAVAVRDELGNGRVWRLRLPLR
jgi:hypothetical protein